MKKQQLLEKEFTELVQEYQHVIWKVCYMYSKDAEHLNDLYQESLINLWKAFPGFRHESKPSTWVYRITLNSCISYFRRFEKPMKTLPLNGQWDCIAEDNQLSSLLQEVYQLINRLNPLEKALILLWLDEKDYQEIAQITGISASNVGTKLSRIKEKLKKLSNQ